MGQFKGFKNCWILVKNNKVFKVRDDIWNTAGGVKAVNLLLDDLNKYFLK